MQNSVASQRTLQVTTTALLSTLPGNVPQLFPRDREGAILPEKREQESRYNLNSTQQSLPGITMHKVVSVGDG